MVINWHGEGCFKIQSGNTTLLTDPSTQRFKADITLITKPEVFDFPVSEPGLIAGPGEYEVKEVEISGWPAKGTAVYLVKMEEMKLCFLGHLAGDLDPAVLENLDDVDILFIPVSEKPFLDLETAAKIVKKISPKIVVPSFLKDPKKFLKEIEYPSETMEKLTIKKKDLVSDKIKIAVLKS